MEYICFSHCYSLYWGQFPNAFSFLCSEQTRYNPTVVPWGFFKLEHVYIIVSNKTCFHNLNFLWCLFWRRKWHPTPVLLPGKSRGRGSLVGYRLWGPEELDTTEQLHFHFSLSCMEKAVANHSSVLAWRIPGTGEAGGLPSMGSHRVGHDWHELVAAAVSLSCLLDTS